MKIRSLAQSLLIFKVSDTCLQSKLRFLPAVNPELISSFLVFLLQHILEALLHDLLRFLFELVNPAEVLRFHGILLICRNYHLGRWVYLISHLVKLLNALVDHGCPLKVKSQSLAVLIHFCKEIRLINSFKLCQSLFNFLDAFRLS